MNAVAVNPYQSPTSPADVVPQRETAGSWAKFALRVCAYSLCGAFLFAAFCTPLNIAQEMFWKPQGPVWSSLWCVLASSLLTGLALDLLVRSELHCVLVGAIWTGANAFVFAVLVMLFPDSFARGFHPEVIGSLVVLAAIFGPIYGILCAHLAVPISAFCVWLGRQGE